ncbi:MAG: sugar transferase [Candidatus Pacebacteria bacterium]|nr:sugar transferase [Candidatus Paceibacterota bacterium]
MNPFSKIKQISLLTGDVFVLYASLLITLLLRYGKFFYFQLITFHLEPFTIMFVVWVIVFYIAGLYDLKSLKNNLEFQKSFLYAIIFNLIISFLFFYTVPYFEITPKTNLILFSIIFAVINFLWRRGFNAILGETGTTTKIMIVGSNDTAGEIINHINNNPQLGYQVKFWMKEGLSDKEFEHLSQIILSNDISTIVIPAHLKKDYESAKLIYKTLVLGIEVVDLSTFYESVFKKVPLAELEEVWFLENLSQRHKIYDLIKEPIERISALILFAILSPLFLLITILIKTTSKGPAVFKQTRVGQKEENFTIYKFRTMYEDAEKDGPQWANYFSDKRATPIGKILRKTHLDELLQLVNVIKGDASFIGPRPERPEFVADLRKQVPYYELRLLVKPGITGWAQINFRYGASVEDTYEKVQHDIYYIKNKSVILDAEILLKTLKFLLTNHS